MDLNNFATSVGGASAVYRIVYSKNNSMLYRETLKYLYFEYLLWTIPLKKIFLKVD